VVVDIYILMSIVRFVLILPSGIELDKLETGCISFLSIYIDLKN